MVTNVASASKARSGLLSDDKGDPFPFVWMVRGRGGGALFFSGTIQCIRVCV